MPFNDWNLDAAEELGYERATKEKNRGKDTFKQIMDILNKDDKARSLLGVLNKVANENKWTEEEYQKGREIIILQAILGNPEAFRVLSDSVWNKINGKEV